MAEIDICHAHQRSINRCFRRRICQQRAANPTQTEEAQSEAPGDREIIGEDVALVERQEEEDGEETLGASAAAPATPSKDRVAEIEGSEEGDRGDRRGRSVEQSKLRGHL